jgi:hypothetical protein
VRCQQSLRRSARGTRRRALSSSCNFHRGQFFERADMMDTKVGQMSKDDPADVARAGFHAMMRGDGDVVAGWKNKLKTSIATVTPAGILAEQHRKLAEPGYSRSNGSAGVVPALLVGVAATILLGCLAASQMQAGEHRWARSRPY